MIELTEPFRAGGYLLSEAQQGHYSADNIVIASGAGVLLPGTVLGQITASGKFVPRDHNASDGSQNAVAVLFRRTDATNADMASSATVRAAEVITSMLVWKTTELAAHQTTGLAQLKALGIIAR